MVNHCRTLLLNAARSNNNTPGEEYVPASFLPIQALPSAVAKIRKLVFGDSPSRVMLNYRLRQIVALWHETELVDFVRGYDNRITYWPTTRDEFYKDAFVPSITSPDNGQLTLVGELTPDENSGQIEYAWKVELTSPTTVRTKLLRAPYVVANHTIAISGGTSSLFQLTGSSLQASVSGTPGDTWFVSAIARPERSMGDILATLKVTVTGSDELTLFGIAPTGNLKTLRDIWKDHHWYGYQLGALMLAVANKMDDIR